MSKKDNDKTFCCVYGCSSSARKSSELSFHLFPKKKASFVDLEMKSGIRQKVDRKAAWEKKLLMGKKVSAYMKVCSLHFRPEDFHPSLFNKSKHILKKTAVPSQNLPKLKNEESSTIKRRPCRKRKSIDVCGNSVPPIESSADADFPLKPSYTVEEEEAAQTLLAIATETENTAALPTSKSLSKAVQVSTGNFRYSLSQLVESDKKLRSLTGLPSLKLLEGLTKMLNNKLKKSVLSVKERIIITMIKLKHNVSYVVLSLLIDSVNANTLKNIIFDVLSGLAFALKPAVQWLSANDVKKHLPKCFNQFADVQVVLDCTEVYVEKPKCLCCRLKLYSQYKSHHTIKWLVGVSPAGLITFVSRAYGGRASDNKIFEQSGIVNKVEPGKAVMVDKGFLIDETCRTHDIKIYRPPFLRNKKQLSPEEAKLNVEIARARVHIERVNQRIKYFKILSGKFPVNLIPKCEEIFFIICCIINLSAPVLASDKF